MKKLSLLLVLMFITLTINAQNVKGNFHSIKASSIFQVILEKSNTCSVNIECPSHLEKYLDVKIEDGVLNLRLNMQPSNNNIFSNNTIIAKVTMPVLGGVYLSGASKLTTNDEFETSNFSCEVSGASKIEQLKIKANANASIDMSGASKVNATIKSNKFSGDLSGASNANFIINTNDLSLELSGASTLIGDVNVRNKTEIDLSGASKATLSGTTSIIKCDASGASNLQAGDLIAKSGDIDLTAASNADVNISDNVKFSKSGNGKLNNKGKGKLQE